MRYKVRGEWQRRGKPTSYRGVRMRSKHETRWARMFDALGWAWLYEPVRTQGYIPDFGLGGRYLAEIKPERRAEDLVRYVPKAITGLNSIAYDGSFAILGGNPILTYGPGLLLYRTGGSDWAVDHSVWAVCSCQRLGLINRTGKVTFRPCGCLGGRMMTDGVDLVALRKFWSGTVRKRRSKR